MKVIKGDLLDAAKKIEQPPLRRNFTEYLTDEDKSEYHEWLDKYETFKNWCDEMDTMKRSSLDTFIGD